ncbi:MAG: hypothetical protein Q8Q42_03510, partial [Nanoarchaeota archaeon]|nr:hypothetical protein [Nanoarchaeota archaeon]
MFSKKRGKMKEHTIFALVFLILVVGFVVFGAGGSTGNISLNKYKMVDGDRVYLGESNYEGSAWPGKDDKNNRRSVSTVSVRPNNNNMRT